MQDSVSVGRFLLQYLDRSGRRKDEQFNFAVLSLQLHFLHHRQRARTRADHQAAALPRYLLFQRKWCMAKGIAEFLGSFFLALADFPAVDHHVVFVGDTIDPNGAK